LSTVYWLFKILLTGHAGKCERVSQEATGRVLPAPRRFLGTAATWRFLAIPNLRQRRRWQPRSPLVFARPLALPLAEEGLVAALAFALALAGTAEITLAVA
jgi:hypothetical protein